MRRRQGRGSLFLNGRSWWMQFYQAGERVRESTGCQDRAAAEDVLKRRMAQVATNKAHGIAPGRATIADLFGLVEADQKLKSRNDKTSKWRWGKHIEKRWGKIAAARFTTKHIRAYIEQRLGEGAANATINRELEIVRRGFNLGLKEDPPLVMRAVHFPMLKEDNVRQGFLEQYDYEVLLEKVPPQLKALYVCAYHVGSRKDELRRIKWEQVDFEAGLIRLPGRVTKNGKPRSLPIYGDMERWLKEQREKCPIENPYVFFGARRLPMGGDLEGWKEACEAAGFAGLLFHDLRRSAVRNMKRAGLKDNVAMAISGHKTRSMFERYDIIDEGDFSDAGQKMAKYAVERKRERAAKLERVK